MKYRCLNCNYRFTPKTGRAPERCPFCSAAAVRKDETGQDILNELSSNDRQR